MSASTAAVLYASVISTSQVKGAEPEDAKDKLHHVKGGTGFRNPWDSYLGGSFFQFVTTLWRRRITGEGNNPDTTPPTVPIHTPKFLPTRETPSLRATWLGHACFLVEFPSGLRVLFDPVFTHRCGPVSWFGLGRYNPAPCNIDEIPFIDAVVISHNHYDHLSHPTVLKIKEKHPNAQFFAGLGNKKWFNESGIHNATELDWWETRELRLSKIRPDGQKKVVGEGERGDSKEDEIVATIGCLPCQHMSGRTPFDRAHSLWASWSVESGGKKVWFGGDTGYRAVPELPDDEDDYGPKYENLPSCPAFKQIGELRGPFDLGLIPVGAYRPRYIMSSVHANPFDSVNIFAETKCKRALGIHWGTWVLTEEDVLEPPKLLKEALKRHDIPETGIFDVCDIGESRQF